VGCKLLLPSNFRSSDTVTQVSPIHTYFVAHAPKLLLSSTFLAAIGVLVDSRLKVLVVPALSFINCLSFLGHKEWRFIIYVVPLLNVAAARGARALSVSLGSLQERFLYSLYAGSHVQKEHYLEGSVSRRLRGCYSRTLYTLWSIPTDLWGTTRGAPLLRGSMSTTKTLTTVHSPILPLKSLAELPLVHVHISNLAAQTGASLFLQTHSAPYYPTLPSPSPGLNWTYDKTENLTTYSTSRFTHLIAEASEPVPLGWKKLDCVKGFDRWSLNPGALLRPQRNVDVADWGALLRVSRQILTKEMSDKLCILERVGE